jgi:single-stranded DNA-binding protein
LLNEVLLVGYLSEPPTEDLTKNGKRMVRARLETHNLDDGGRTWRTFISLVGFGRAGERLLTYGSDALLVVRGRLSWLPEVQGIVVACRDVSIFALTGDALEVEADG